MAIGIPAQELAAQLRTSMSRVFIVSFIMLLIGLGAALLVSRLLVR